MFFDPLYLLFMLPGLIIAGMASAYTHSTFEKFKRFRASSGRTGAQAAQRLLASAGIYDVRIECVGGFLTDHYDPSAKVLRLSPDVFNGISLSAIGVACHEAGHAIQHATAYGPLGLRSALVPLTNFASFGSYIVIMIGFIFASQQMILWGAILFGATVLFAIVTLPVEWDASARAKKTDGNLRYRNSKRERRSRGCSECGIYDICCLSRKFSADAALLSDPCRSFQQ